MNEVQLRKFGVCSENNEVASAYFSFRISSFCGEWTRVRTGGDQAGIRETALETSSVVQEKDGKEWMMAQWLGPDLLIDLFF